VIEGGRWKRVRPAVFSLLFAEGKKGKRREGKGKKKKKRTARRKSNDNESQEGQ